MEPDRDEEGLLSILDCRRRNGSDGIRYVGKSAGGEGIDGKGGMVCNYCHCLMYYRIADMKEENRSQLGGVTFHETGAQIKLRDLLESEES